MIFIPVSIGFKKIFFSPNLPLIMMVFLTIVSCKTSKSVNYSIPAETTIKSKIKSTKFLTGADNVKSYLSLLKNKRLEL